MSDRLRISKKLYGRERETELLARNLGRVVANGVPRIVLVSGPAGAGKRTCARSIEDRVSRVRGIFVTGTFDDGAAPSPYSAIAEALGDVVSYILGEGEPSVAQWRAHLIRSLGPIGQLAVDLVPSLATIIGEQPTVPELPLSEAQGRFFLIVRRLVSALATRGHVLALVLDDLHRSDVASLALVEHLVTHPETGPLMVIGAYCDEELAPDHPLHSFMRALRSRPTITEEIAIAPLTFENVAELCADSLSSPVERIVPLARVVWEATGGNALLVTQLLAQLHRAGYLVFDVEDRAWRWDLTQIGSIGTCRDVAASTLAQLQDLGRETREALELGACLGIRFDDRMLALVTSAPVADTRRTLERATEIGLLGSVRHTYRFLHAWIHEAIYTSLPDRRRAELHLRIGWRLLERLAPDEQTPHIFEIARQLNRGAPLLGNLGDRARVAEVNLRAGRAAATTCAYAAATHYLVAGLQLLGPSVWREREQLAFDLHLEHARCELAQRHLEEAQRMIDVLREHAPTADRERAVDRLQLDVHLSRDAVSDAARVGIKSLAARGVDLRWHPSSPELAAAERAVWQALADRSIESLAELPILTDHEVEVTLDMLAAILPAAYLTDPQLHAMVACRMAVLSIRHGITGASATGFAAFAMALVSTLERPADGVRFAELALHLIEKRGFVAHAGRTFLVVGVFVLPKVGTLGDAVDRLRSAHQAALEIGDVVFAGYSGVQIVALRLARGDSLDDVARELRVLLESPDWAGFGAVAKVLRVHLGLISNLQGRTRSASTFTGDDVDEDELMLESETEIPLVESWFRIRKLQADCIHRDHAAALEHAERVRPLLWATTGQLCNAEYHFYAALARAALARAAPEGLRAAHRLELADHERALRVWAGANPQSFVYMQLLVAAERARLDGEALDAMQLYEQAIHAAHDNGFTQGVALAYECAASFYAELRFQAFADLYLREARRCYLAWGAHSKVRALDERRRDLARAVPPLPVAAPDQLSLLKTSQVISSEIVRPKLLGTLTQTLMEQTGAHRAVFLSIRDHQAVPESIAGPVGGVPESIVEYVMRTHERVVLHDATRPDPHSTDAYLARARPRSVLCLPIVRHGDLLGIVYLEHGSTPGLFTIDKLTVLELLAEQAGISLENARLYADRGREIAERRGVEATLQSILNNIVDGVFVCDRAAHLTFINPAGARMLGLEPGAHPDIDELARRLQATHPDGRPFALDELPLVRALAGEVVSSDDATVRDLRTERATHVRVSAAPLQDEKGAIAGAVAVVFNVTEAVELERLREQFVRVVAHELKTPLTVVKGYADVLRRMDTIPDHQRRLLGRLVRGADRIDRLVTDILMVWQLQTGGLELAIEPRVDFRDLIDLVVGRLDPDAARRISVDVVRPVVAAGDRQLLDKVISNVVDNALRYSRADGHVEIEAGVQDEHAVVIVTDHGIGIPRTDQARLFEPFFRVHTDTPYDTGGLGIGLYIARAIVLLHGGKISVESAEGTGTKVRFMIPLRRPIDSRSKRTSDTYEIENARDIASAAGYA